MFERKKNIIKLKKCKEGEGENDDGCILKKKVYKIHFIKRS